MNGRRGRARRPLFDPHPHREASMCRSAGTAVRLVFFLSLALLLVVDRGAAQGTDRPSTPVAAIVLNDTKLEAEVGRSIADIDRRVRTVIDQLGLRITRAPESTTGARREYQAHGGDRIVEIAVVEGTARRTTVSVSSFRLFQGRSNGLRHDTDHAHLVIERILRQN